MNMTQLSPWWPYLLRALYEWCINNQLTPNLLVDANAAGLMLSMEFAHNGKIVLNIAPNAVTHLVLGNVEVQFNACFGGVPRHVVVPITAVLAIYASENGTGIMLEPEYKQQMISSFSSDETQDTHPTLLRGDCRPCLRVVK